MRGTLTGGIDTAGRLSLLFKGKSVGSLKAGRYKVSLLDETAKAAFILRLLNKQPRTLSGKAFVGRHTVTVSLKAGQWMFYSSPVQEDASSSSTPEPDLQRAFARLARAARGHAEAAVATFEHPRPELRARIFEGCGGHGRGGARVRRGRVRRRRRRVGRSDERARRALRDRPRRRESDRERARSVRGRVPHRARATARAPPRTS